MVNLVINLLLVQRAIPKDVPRSIHHCASTSHSHASTAHPPASPTTLTPPSTPLANYSTTTSSTIPPTTSIISPSPTHSLPIINVVDTSYSLHSTPTVSTLTTARSHPIVGSRLESTCSVNHVPISVFFLIPVVPRHSLAPP